MAGDTSSEACLVPSCVQTPAPPWVFMLTSPNAPCSTSSAARSLLGNVCPCFALTAATTLHDPHQPLPESLNVRPSAARPQVTSGDSFGGSSSASLEFPREPPQITTDSVAQIHSFRHSGGQQPMAGGPGEEPCVSPSHCGASPALALITPAQARLPTRPRPGAPRGLAAGGAPLSPLHRPKATPPSRPSLVLKADRQPVLGATRRDAARLRSP